MIAAAAVIVLAGLALSAVAGMRIVNRNTARWTWSTQLGEIFSDARADQPLALAYVGLGVGTAVLGLVFLAVGAATR